MLNYNLQLFGGRGVSGLARGSGGGSTGGARIDSTANYQKTPSSAPIGTKLSMGPWTYTKTGEDTWRTTYDGKRQSNRKNADIKRVFM